MITAENIIRPLRTGCLLDRSLALPTRYSYSIQSECYTYVVPPLRTIRYSRVFFVISRTSTRRSTSFYKLEPRRRSNSGEWIVVRASQSHCGAERVLGHGGTRNDTSYRIPRTRYRGSDLSNAVLAHLVGEHAERRSGGRCSRP